MFNTDICALFEKYYPQECAEWRQLNNKLDFTDEDYDRQDELFDIMYKGTLNKKKPVKRTLLEVWDGIDEWLEDARQAGDYEEAKKWGLKKAAFLRALKKSGMSTSVQFTSLGFTA